MRFTLAVALGALAALGGCASNEIGSAPQPAAAIAGSGGIDPAPSSKVWWCECECERHGFIERVDLPPLQCSAPNPVATLARRLEEERNAMVRFDRLEDRTACSCLCAGAMGDDCSCAWPNDRLPMYGIAMYNGSCLRPAGLSLDKIDGR